MTVSTPPVLPALAAVNEIRKEIKRRIGKEGGHLNRMFLAQLDTIETTLRQIEPLGSMLQTLNQQSEVTLHGFRALSRIQAALPEPTDPNGDDGSSDTKGT